MLIHSLDEARRVVAASASLNLCMAKLNKWGFESSTQFYAVAVPGQANPKSTNIVHKSDGKIYASPVADYKMFD